ncbi:hypothetical protein SAMN05216359_10523 [Roseateles sp. YR242]|uniref:hypothetical protein n=1 Tax=Roseateles sp. YR242 TaxID=1855305 RepID=UPI0008C35B37|nr:hypothetical protein [Roseateles sp. YR242]SEL06653.1 hypothetical protein SAMN05216359_10523 [Roseateles sp. YR242]
MKLLTNTSTTALITAGAVLSAVMMLAAPVFAAEGEAAGAKPAPATNAATPGGIYAQERARCLSGNSAQDQKTCLKEAAAARDEARRGTLKSASQDELANNALLRCQRVAEEDRPDCRAMVLGQGTRDGSVESGAILKRIDRMVEENPTGAGAATNPANKPATAPALVPQPSPSSTSTPERPKVPPRPLKPASEAGR